MVTMTVVVCLAMTMAMAGGIAVAAAVGRSMSVGVALPDAVIVRWKLLRFCGVPSTCGESATKRWELMVDIKYPTDAGLASHGVRSLAREGRKLASEFTQNTARVRDRSRSMGRKLRAIARTIRRRSGEAKAEVLALTEQTGKLLQQSVKEARRLAVTARRKARGRGARAKLRATARLDELADRCEKVARQIKQRVAGEKITDRLISLSDPDARPIRKGKLGKPNEFGLRRADRGDHAEHQARRARTDRAGRVAGRQPGREPVAATDRRRARPAWPFAARGRAGRWLRDRPDQRAAQDLDPEQVFISGRQQPGSRRTQRLLQRYRTGAEGAISHLKRGCGMRRSRLKGDDGQMTARRPGPAGASSPTTSTP